MALPVYILKTIYHTLEQKSILMYKTLHGVTPDYLKSRFVYLDNVTAYRLRNTKNKLIITSSLTDLKS